MKRKLAWFGLGFALAELFAASMPSLVFLPAAALFGLLAFLYRKSCIRLSFAGALLGILFFSAFYIVTVRPVESYAGQEAVCTVVVETDAEPSYQEGMLRGTLLVTSREGKRTHYRVYCSAFPGMEPGERFTARFSLEALKRDNYQMYYRSQGVYLQAEYLGEYEALPASGALPFVLFRVRESLARTLQKWMPQEEGALETAVLLGDKSGLSETIEDAFRAAGVSHLLAVSGLHVALLCGIFSFGSKRRFLRPLILLRAAFVLFYMALTGMSISVVRAGIVFLIALAGQFFWQPVDLLTSTGIAALLIGLQNGYATCDLGFQLSFCAVVGVQLAGELAKWEKSHLPISSHPLAELGLRFAVRLLEAVQVAFFAALATLPVLLVQGLSTSGVGVLTNLLVVWMLAPALQMGIVILLLSLFPMLEPAFRIFSLALSLWLRLLTTIVTWCASLPLAHIALPERYTLWVLAILACLAVLFWRYQSLIWYLPVAAVCTAAAIGLGFWAQQDVVQIALVGTANNPCAVCLQNGEAVILFRGGQSNLNAVQEYLTEQAGPKVDAWIDLRQSPTELDFGEGQLLSMEEMSTFFLRQNILDDLSLDLYHDDSGNLAVLGVGDRHIAVSTGNIQLESPVCVDVLCVAGSLPDYVQAQTLVFCTERPAWLAEVDQQVLYRGLDEPVITIRPGVSMIFEEAERIAVQ